MDGGFLEAPRTHGLGQERSAASGSFREAHADPPEAGDNGLDRAQSALLNGQSARQRRSLCLHPARWDPSHSVSDVKG